MQNLCDERSLYHHNALTQTNIDAKAAGEVVVVLSENASLTDLRLRLERVGVSSRRDQFKQ